MLQHAENIALPLRLISIHTAHLRLQMRGSIESLPTLGDPGHIEGQDGVVYAFYITDFSSEEVRLDLTEWMSVEFDPDPGEVSRALNCVLVAQVDANDIASPTIEDVASTSAQPSTEEPAAKPEPDARVPAGYSVPSPAPIVCKGESPAGWEIIVSSKWLVRGSSKTGPDEAKRIMMKRARALQANALLAVQYSRTEILPPLGNRKEPSFAHHYHGRLAIVARKEPGGKLTREALSIDIDEEAELESSRLAQGAIAARQGNYVLYGGCLAVVLVTGVAAGYLSLLTLIVGSAAAFIATKLTQDTAVDNYLTSQPVEDGGASIPTDQC